MQARKTYVSLITPRRTFARVQATTRNRLDLGLRLEKDSPGGRLTPSRIHPTMPLQISFSSLEELDDEALESAAEGVQRESLGQRSKHNIRERGSQPPSLLLMLQTSLWTHCGRLHSGLPH